MKLGGNQPYFFPYPGYFSLIKATEKWIVFDTPQYKKGSWMNRNRVIKLNSNDWKYFTVPVKKHELKTSIYNIKVQDCFNWKERLIAQLDHYQRYAPYYEEVIEFLHEILKAEFDRLSELNIHILKGICDYINIEFDYEVFSKMDIKIEPVHEPDEWALNICKAMGAKELINSEGGKLFMDSKKFHMNNVKLKFLEFGYTAYDQRTPEFIPGLSIIDTMMFNSPSEINHIIDDYRLVS